MLPVTDEVSQLDQEIARLEAEALRQAEVEEKYVDDNKLSLFEPHEPNQMEFFRRAATRRRACFCGNRWGKSTAGVAEDCSWLLGYRPFFSEGNPLRYEGIPTHGVKILVIAEDWDKVHELFTNPGQGRDDPNQGKFFSFLPESVVKKTRRNNAGVIDTIYTENILHGKRRVSSVWFDTVKSFQHSGMSHESSDWDAVHGDEPFPEDLWKAVARGLMDRDGFAWILATSISYPWIYRKFCKEMQEQPQNYWYCISHTDENPTLSEEAKRIYFENLTPEEIECRRKGLPLAFGKLVYSMFDRDKHVWDETRGKPAGWQSWDKPPADDMVVAAIDVHPETPHAALFCSLSPHGYKFFYSEIYEKCLISELASKILKSLAGCRIGYILLDRIAWVRNPETGGCWADTFLEYGLPVQQAPKNKEAGIMQTKELWRGDNKVYVFPEMARFLYEIEVYHYNKENKPVDKDDHMMENLYRLTTFDNLQWYPATVDYPQVSVDPVEEISRVGFSTYTQQQNPILTY